MKLSSSFLSLSIALALAPGTARADLFGDSIGDTIQPPPGGGILDITSVEVSLNATDLIFKINLVGNPSSPDWGKYMIGIDSVPGGDTSVNGNGWTRPISMTSGMDYWLGSWVDSGNGAEAYKFVGGWSLLNATYAVPGGLSISKDASSVTLRYPFASLGLAFGSPFKFDVYTSGGGGSDSAVDSLANPGQSIADWPGPYASDLGYFYTIPEPGALALLGLGISALAAGRGLLRRRA